MNKRIATFKLIPVLLLLPLLATGCDKADNPIAPSGSTLSISANPSRIGVNGVSTLTITGFRPDGNRLNPGTQISLTATVGTLSSSIVTIGADGYTTATLRADGRIGASSVKARLTTDAAAGGVEVMIDIGAAAPKLLIVTDKTELDPAEESWVTFFARDENDLPLGAGEVIQVAASLGTMTVDGREVTSVTTGADGRAVAKFKAGGQAGTATITAFLRNSPEKTATLTIRDRAASFQVIASDDEVSDDGDIRLTVIVSNAAGRPAQGILVIFGVDGASGTFTATSQNTDVNGTATTTFKFNQSSATPAGSTFTLTVTVVINGSPQTQTKTITVRGG